MSAKYFEVLFIPVAISRSKKELQNMGCPSIWDNSIIVDSLGFKKYEQCRFLGILPCEQQDRFGVEFTDFLVWFNSPTYIQNPPKIFLDFMKAIARKCL